MKNSMFKKLNNIFVTKSKKINLKNLKNVLTFKTKDAKIQKSFEESDKKVNFSTFIF
jgi:hypothetical protein